MEARPFQRLCVVGAGFMGTQIALHGAVHGYEVWLVDAVADALTRAAGQQHEEIEARSRAHRLTAKETRAILARLHATTDLAKGVGGADVIIEAVPESLDVKRELFAGLGRLCPPGTLLASNSSALSCSAFAEASGRPEDVVNLHFHPPIWRRPLVEVLGGVKTAPATIARAVAFARSVDLTPIMVRRENTGFVLNCIWRAVKNQSLELVDRGVASPEDIDRAWMIATDMDAGPFGLMDMVGLDVVRDIETVYRQQAEGPVPELPGILTAMIAAGRLGVKTGRGFYKYPDPAYRRSGWLRGG